MNDIHFVEGYGKKQHVLCNSNLLTNYNATNEVSFVSCPKCKLILKYRKL